MKRVKFKCDNGKVYSVPIHSCCVCANANILWDYTNGPYGCICEVDGNPHKDGVRGTCPYYKNMELEE